MNSLAEELKKVVDELKAKGGHPSSGEGEKVYERKITRPGVGYTGFESVTLSSGDSVQAVPAVKDSGVRQSGHEEVRQGVVRTPARYHTSVQHPTRAPASSGPVPDGQETGRHQGPGKRAVPHTILDGSFADNDVDF